MYLIIINPRGKTTNPGKLGTPEILRYVQVILVTLELRTRKPQRTDQTVCVTLKKLATYTKISVVNSPSPLSKHRWKFSVFQPFLEPGPSFEVPSLVRQQP